MWQDCTAFVVEQVEVCLLNRVSGAREKGDARGEAKTGVIEAHMSRAVNAATEVIMINGGVHRQATQRLNKRTT